VLDIAFGKTHARSSMLKIERRLEKTELKMKKPKTSSTPAERVRFGARLKQLVQTLGVDQKQLALSGRISAATVSAYLAGNSQPAADIISNWVRDFRVNANWLLTGEGEMLLDAQSASLDSIPAEEVSATLSPTQREMYAYKRLQTELGMPKTRIAEGIEAIVRGKPNRPGLLSGYAATNKEMDDRFDNAHGDEAMYDKDT
jgi:transcriptional regulator with XRE-family HTH domain